MVVPPHTRGVWKAVRENFKRDVNGQCFLVVGSAGIGKSRTINFLIREIIKERRQDTSQPLPTIIFEHRKDHRVWKFAPNDPTDHSSDYKVSHIHIAIFLAKDEPALSNPNNVYIVDSGKAEDSKIPALVTAKTVYVCSPDTRHFDEWSKHMQTGGKFYFPIWIHEAIEAARLYLLSLIHI